MIVRSSIIFRNPRTIASLAACLLAMDSEAAPKSQPVPDYVTPEKQILETIRKTAPSAGGPIPADLPARLGAAHVSGKYHFTDKPFLLEGCEDLLGLGFRSVKLWFTKLPEAYPYNSDWNLPADSTLADLAKHPYFTQAFAMPFDVIALEVQPVENRKNKAVKGFAMNPDSDFAEDERQIHDLADHLLKTYKDRPVTFLLQNWEGDWMLRGGAKDDWAKGEYPGLERRSQAFIRWLQARQRGVERARAENPDTKCRVLHAVEVNQVLPTWKGVPTLTSHVLPHAKTDLVSWSCYDGMRNDKRSAEQTAIGLWQGIDTIRHFARSAHNGRDVPVYIGEIGIPEEKGFTKQEIAAIWDGAFAALFALDVPYILQWQLYDNEIKDGVPHDQATYSAEELNGYWIRKPDGSLSPTGDYLTALLKRAGQPKK